MLPLLLAPTLPTLDLPLPAGPGPVSNPLKGYAPYVQEGGLKGVPTTMAFYEVPWRELEPKRGELRFAEWEAKTLRAAASKDKRVVLRVWIDYPDLPLGLPDWLLDAGVKTTPYADEGIGKGRSPDYADPRLRAALRALIRAMGARWDRDPQVAYVQLGLLGHWGEWHTYPRPELFAPEAVQREVVDGMRAAFPDKPLMGRTATGALNRPWMGYHDDLIPDDTLGPEDWKFLPNLRTAGRADNWRVSPTGGEMVPGAAARYLGADWPLTLRAVREAHLSWIGPYGPTMVDSKDPAFRARAAELSRKLGYEFRLTRVRVAGGRVRLDGVNDGVAPFYGRWPVRFALLDATGGVASTADAPTDARGWLPGPFAVDAALPKAPKPGTYRLAVGLVDPWTGKPDVRFANRLPLVDGWTVLTPRSGWRAVGLSRAGSAPSYAGGIAGSSLAPPGIPRDGQSIDHPEGRKSSVQRRKTALTWCVSIGRLAPHVLGRGEAVLR